MLQVLKRTDDPAVKAAQLDRELSWLASHIERGRNEVYSEVVTITPAIARHILEHNHDNRTIKNQLVDTIADDIASDQWAMNGESIIISRDGFLNDGQHRLNAIVQANKAVRSVVTFGVDRASRFTIDIGSARTTGDFLGMEGAPNKNAAASVAKMFNVYRRGLYSPKGQTRAVARPATKVEIRSEYWRNKKMIDAGIDACQDKLLKSWGMTALPCAFVILHARNPGQTEVFFEKLRNGADLKINDPILFFRSHIMSSRVERLDIWNKLELSLRYWNAWRTGRKLSKKLVIRGEYPEVEA